MSHLNAGKEQAYQMLAERLSHFPVGVKIDDTLMAILQLLYSEQEAAVGSKFPMKPRPFAEIKDLTAMEDGLLREILSSMASKGLVIDIERKNTTYYMLSPVVVGFFEYSMMRVDSPHLGKLAQLFDQYFQDKDVASEIFGSDTKMFRALVYEKYIPELISSEVLHYERASQVIRDSGGGALSLCACRHKNYHLNKPCRYPMEDICTSLGRPAEWLISKGFARRASVDELLKNLDRSYSLGLVLTADNVINEPAYICHCCSCCCGPLQAIIKHSVRAVQPSGFKPLLDKELCSSCDLCLESCHVKAISLSDTGEYLINDDTCIGCGVCASACSSNALSMIENNRDYVLLGNKMAQLVNIAIEKNRF